MNGAWAHRLGVLLALGCLAGSPGWARVDTNLAKRVVVVYNQLEPESQPLAEYYAERRGIPTNQLFGIRIRPSETITHREFKRQIREPILDFLLREGLLDQRPTTIEDLTLGSVPSLQTVDNKVSYIALMYGVPLRIDHDPSIALTWRTEAMPKQFRRTESAVDSELSLLPTVSVSVMGPLRNLFYGSRVIKRFGPPMDRFMVMVGRLDGPDPDVVRRMIDDAIDVEEYGLHGRAYFDIRGTLERGYLQGDKWIRTASQLARQAGFESDLDQDPPTFKEDYPMTDVAMYSGWYATHADGPFRRLGFRFRPGAIGYHLHSSSAASLRTRHSHWAGPMLDKGAAVVMGTVFEPYLPMTPHVDMFFERLLQGGTFLEAAYYSQPVLSWQSTFIGDPLYAPFAVPLDDQIARLEADDRPELGWAYVRKVNLLMNSGQIAEAETLCREKANQLGKTELWEKLGDLLRVTGRGIDSIEAYKKAMQNPDDPYRYIRLATKLANTYEENGRKPQAIAVYEGLATVYPRHRQVLEFYKKAYKLAKEIDDQEKLQSLEAKITSLLKGSRGR